MTRFSNGVMRKSTIRRITSAVVERSTPAMPRIWPAIRYRSSAFLAATWTSRSSSPDRPCTGQTVAMTRLRKVIADNMVAALRTSAQLTTVIEADVTGLIQLRDRAAVAVAAREGVKLSPLPFFVKAAADTLKAHPVINASINVAEGTITYHDAEHIGLAVDTERGLLVPVIRDAGDLSVAGIAKKAADLARRARDSKLAPDELAGGTFSVTNTGSRGALFDTPVFVPPQVAILGIRAVRKRPAVLESPALGDVIVARHLVYLSLSYDHQIVDGADAARFLGALRARLEAIGPGDDLGR